MYRQRVPDDGGCNMKALLSEPGPGAKNYLHDQIYSKICEYDAIACDFSTQFPK